MSDFQSNALPADYVLGRYTIRSVLGAGGFGITYRATYADTGEAVAIKEYLPSGISARGSDGASVHPISTEEKDSFAYGLERFRREAQTLARFHHPAIVSVLGFFEANGTAYTVMGYERGESLAGILDRYRRLEESELEEILVPLLDGLETVHRAGVFHRDIKPDNIFIRIDGTPVLLDFGAARQDLGDRSHSVKVVVSPPYAPVEQYSSDGNIGPWTDIYALAITLYVAATGQIPAEATKRGHAALRQAPDPLVPIGQLVGSRFSSAFVQAVQHGMTLREDRRPRTIGEWRAEFKGEVPAAAPSEAAASPSAPSQSAASDAASAVASTAASPGVSAAVPPGDSAGPVGAPAAAPATAKMDKPAGVADKNGEAGEPAKERPAPAAESSATAKAPDPPPAKTAADAGQMPLPIGERRPAAKPASDAPAAPPPHLAPPALGAGGRWVKPAVIAAVALISVALIVAVGWALWDASGEKAVVVAPHRDDQGKAEEARRKAEAEAQRKVQIEARREAIAARRQQLEEERKRVEKLSGEDRFAAERDYYARVYAAQKATADKYLEEADKLHKERDFRAAHKLYLQAADLGQLDAQVNLGFYYTVGNGTKKDDDEAAKWFRRAAERGHKVAQSNLSGLYTSGRGVKRDYTLALQWARRAAAQDYAAAYGRLGYLYRHGLGVDRDYAKSMEWYRKAANKNHAWSMAEIGNLYENALGVKRDIEKAARWYRLAAKRGNAYAQRRLKALGL